MRFFEAKVLVPQDGDRTAGGRLGQWEAFLLHLYGGFHKGASVQGQTGRWGKEYMVPYYVGFETGVSAPKGSTPLSLKIGPITRAVKDIFGEEAVYIAVTELAAPFIH